jgi:serine/threonine protein kinase
MDVLHETIHEEDWPLEAEAMYERIEVLGKGSFGLVWMARRVTKPVDDDDDEYVALKNIEIKEEKGKVYAQREISILSELRHPNVIRLIRAFPVHRDTSRLVALQLARGPNLQRVVTKGGALGLPLSRLISRQLVAATSYLHGRGVLHRDIKPTNCILENTELPTGDYYDFTQDLAIWSDGPEAQEAVARNRWKMMLVDFGFARALTHKEITAQSRPMRNSILLERKHVEQVASDDKSSDSLSELDDMLIAQAAATLRRESIQDVEHFVGMGDEDLKKKQRKSHVSNFIGIDEEKEKEAEEKKDDPPSAPGSEDLSSSPTEKRRKSRIRTSITAITRRNRMSTTRKQMRSMSALGTKAYAAPEIKHKLRNKTSADHEKSNAALTECVADYGMIVDAFSVGWTLRVIMTGVPPNSTISQYMKKYNGREVSEEIVTVGCCCCSFDTSTSPPGPKSLFRVRDTDQIPKGATMFISALTKANPEERMSIREAQNHPWIRGDDREEPYEVLQGDFPSHHGDPVVPLKCAGELSRIVEMHHA